jgi:hypothetical protein
MNLFRKAIEFFVYSNIYIALGAILMVYQTTHIFNLPLGEDFFFFAFSATIMSYSFHWYLLSDVENSYERQIWTHSHKKLLFILFIISTLPSIYFFTKLTDHWFWILSIGIITFFYSAVKIPYKPFLYLRTIAIEKTLYLAIVWTYITAVLPFIVADSIFQFDSIVFILNRFFLIYAICILFDIRDREPDKQARTKNSITLLSMQTVEFIFKTALLLFFMSAILLSFFELTNSQLIALALPGILLTFSFKKSINTRSGLWYYLYLDGLMMLSGLVMYINSLI